MPRVKSSIKTRFNPHQRINRFKQKLIDCVDGELHVVRRNPTPTFRESIRVGVAIGQLTFTNRNEQEWAKLMAKTQATTSEAVRFTIGSKTWNRTGRTWIIPTMTFGKTQIKINLKASEMLEYGFRIDVFTRTGIFSKTIHGGPYLATGGTICLHIVWQVSADKIIAAPSFAGSINDITFEPNGGHQLIQ